MESKTNNAIDLSQYVSNTDKNVYTIFNLPEEVIAVIFAYVSRSPKSFRENLRQLLEDEELGIQQGTSSQLWLSKKASSFHEKWVVQYGHSSVAEHAVAHVGIEQISRLASAALELATSFGSFTEYSQRYQRPQRGAYYLPIELAQAPHLKERFIAVQEENYSIYEELFHQLVQYLQKEIPLQAGESERAYKMRIEKIAFEDARYVLSNATFTQLGMTINGRAVRDAIVQLLSSPYPEMQELGQQLTDEVSQVIPTLLRHIKANQYQLKTRENLHAENYAKLIAKADWCEGESKSHARILSVDEELTTLRKLASLLLMQFQELGYDEADKRAEQATEEELKSIVSNGLSNLQFFDHPLELFQHVNYTVQLQISEANWHQLLRHNRKTHFTYQEPTIVNGYTIPPHIVAAGATAPFQRAMENANQLYVQLINELPQVAPYAVTNAHHRQLMATISLWELYHLINLRTSDEAQWDIRQTFQDLHDQLQQIHPTLLHFAKRRP